MTRNTFEEANGLQTVMYVQAKTWKKHTNVSRIHGALSSIAKSHGRHSIITSEGSATDERSGRPIKTIGVSVPLSNEDIAGLRRLGGAVLDVDQKPIQVRVDIDPDGNKRQYLARRGADDADFRDALAHWEEDLDGLESEEPVEGLVFVPAERDIALRDDSLWPDSLQRWDADEKIAAQHAHIATVEAEQNLIQKGLDDANAEGTAQILQRKHGIRIKTPDDGPDFS